jgi:oligopeptide/dipeptide ABC transporter ATP-binding protein
MAETLLSARQLKKHYPVKSNDHLFRYDWLKALDGVDFDIYEGETLGLVGESGCGKSTTRRLLLKIEPPTEGEIYYKGKNISEMSRPELKAFRRNVQMVYQDPYASLDPKWKVLNLITEPLRIHGIGSPAGRKEKALELMRLVGMREGCASAYPHEFSGGQRQRICIARALALDPQMIIADEPVSALDVSIQAQVLNLFMELKERLKLTYLFISHDLNVIRYISDRVAVMYLGKIVEVASTAELFANPRHPYTIALLKAIPVPDPKEKLQFQVLGGEVPSPINTPAGCAFHPRCEYAEDRCREEAPALRQLDERHQVACHLLRIIT